MFGVERYVSPLLTVTVIDFSALSEDSFTNTERQSSGAD